MNVKIDNNFTFSECIQLSDNKLKALLLVHKSGKEDILNNSKIGKISIKKISDNAGYLNKNNWFSGITANFGEGMGVYISDTAEWFQSSVITSIDWDKNQFETLNSTYEFRFEELDEEVLNKIYEYYENPSN